MLYCFLHFFFFFINFNCKYCFLEMYITVGINESMLDNIRQGMPVKLWILKMSWISNKKAFGFFHRFFFFYYGTKIELMVVFFFNHLFFYVFESICLGLFSLLLLLLLLSILRSYINIQKT
jgi:hypothetical protein